MAEPDEHDRTAELLPRFEHALSDGTGSQQLAAARALLTSPCPRPPGRERAFWLLARACVAMIEAHYETGADDLAEAADLLDDPADAALALIARMEQQAARTAVHHAQLDIALDALRRIDELAEQLDSTGPTDRQRVSALLARGYARTRVQRHDAATALFDEAATLARTSYDRCRVLCALSLVAAQSGAPKLAAELAATATELAQQIDDRVQLALMLRLRTGLFEQPDELQPALEMADEAVRAAADLGPAFIASTLRLRGLLRTADGRERDGVRDLAASVGLLAEAGVTETLASEVLTLAQTLQSIDELSAASETLRRHDAVLNETVSDLRIEIDLARYQVASEIGEPASAAGYAENAAGLMVEAHYAGASSAYRLAADAWLLAGHPERAAAARAAGERLAGPDR